MAPSAERDSTSGRSNDDTGNSRRDSSVGSKNGQGRAIAKGGVLTPFPWKLHIMLDAMDETRDKSIVCWQPHGKAFMVHKPKNFVEEVMPLFFNQTKYASFQRQLNLYGFSRLTHGPDKGAYYHRLFIRGQRDLCKGMVRQKIKGTKVRKPLAPEAEPNFYNEENQMNLAQFFIHQSFCQNDIERTSHPSSTQSSIDLFNDVTKSVKLSQAISSEESSLASPVSLIPSDPTVSYNKISRGAKATTQTDDFGSEMSVPRCSQRYTPRYRLFDHYILPTQAEIIKGGDLLFFEGQPFRYLEHFEEIPPNHQLLLKKITANAFQSRISSMMNDLDSSSLFESDIMSNTSCST